SPSMADKQSLLAAAIPTLLRRFVTPNCLDAQGNVLGASSNGACATGQIEFAPLHDIHIAVVTSSLGSHGGDLCDGALNGDDHGQALASVRTGLAHWNNAGFLAWDPGGTRNVPPGDETQPTTFATDLQATITAAGDQGCGLPATLEAWYRFLVDPEP